MARTHKNVIHEGYTTYSDDGKQVFRTHKNVIHEGYTTYSQDGTQTFQTHKNIIDEGTTTYQVDTPTRNPSSDKVNIAGADFGGSIALLVVAFFLSISCMKVLEPIAYVYAALIVISPLLAGACERIHISRIWASGLLFGWAALKLISIVFADVWGASNQDGGTKAMVLCALALLLLIGLYLAIHGVREEGLGYVAFVLLLITLPIDFIGEFGST